MGRRTILLIAALVVAGLGTTLVFLYAKGANDRALEGQVPVQVLFVKAQVATGTTGNAAASAGSFELRTVASDSKAPGALSDIAPVADLVALAPLFPGQQVLQQQFGAASSAAALPIPPGKMAMSVQLGDPERVAGFVGNGSEVAVFVTIANPNRGAATTAPDVTQVLLPRVQVIGVGSTTLVQTASDANGGTNTEQIPKAILTLALDQDQASKLVYATQKGELYFALLTPTSKVAPGGSVTSQNLLK